VDMVSAECRVVYLSLTIDFINRWVVNSVGVSEEVLRALVKDAGNFLNEKRDLTFRVDKSKAVTKFDEKMTILEAECYVDSIVEMSKINEEVAFGISKFVLGGVMDSSDAGIARLYQETSSMLASIFEIEERLKAVKSKTMV